MLNDSIEPQDSNVPKKANFLQRKWKILLPLVVVLVCLAVFAVIKVLSKPAVKNISGGSPNSGQTTQKKAQNVVKLYNNPEDKDFDGLNAEEEKKLGTSDLNVDTDGDGLSDYVEVKVWHTDPKKPDTDGDGFTDGYEVIKGYDPLVKGKKLAK